MDYQALDAAVADVWDDYVGDVHHRLAHYADFLVDFLRKHNSRHVLDAACGTGIDSIMLLERGFKVTSVDASQGMVHMVLKKRWDRRKEKAFDEWEIVEADWLTMPRNLTMAGKRFDAIICIGNSIPYLKDMEEIKLAIQNFHHFLKPGGWLIVDHRNFESNLGKGHRPNTCMYYSGTVFKVNTVEQTSEGIIRNVYIDSSSDKATSLAKYNKENSTSGKVNFKYRIFPIQRGDFTSILRAVFGEGSKHEVYGDYKSSKSEENTSFFIHFIQKETENSQ
ncbi:hypothetical protein JTE90_017396 [Oedothorax gibbosus]|uniref:Glycine N-methyltransferase n=1 Tax=Oedothorax gibbosus TaxID=931172 RepID=A0AAV6TUS2_9ARAC|nr:hypothetical protein JTE90_017396 [Oedothorax gibbosus]